MADGHQSHWAVTVIHTTTLLTRLRYGYGARLVTPARPSRHGHRVLIAARLHLHYVFHIFLSLSNHSVVDSNVASHVTVLSLEESRV